MKAKSSNGGIQEKNPRGPVAEVPRTALGLSFDGFYKLFYP